MKTDKKTLMMVIDFLQSREGWDFENLKSEIIEETNLLKHSTMGSFTLSTDECSVEWGEDYICDLDNFIDKYTDIFIEKMCNVLESFVDNEID